MGVELTPSADGGFSDTGSRSRNFEETAMSDWIESFIKDLDSACERRRQSDRAVAEACGISVAELDADTTAPDEREEEE
jgi:hypothetical protein